MTNYVQSSWKQDESWKEIWDLDIYHFKEFLTKNLFGEAMLVGLILKSANPKITLLFNKLEFMYSYENKDYILYVSEKGISERGVGEKVKSYKDSREWFRNAPQFNK